jgi:hypothetical protein
MPALLGWRHDTQPNDIQHKSTQHNDSQDKKTQHINEKMRQ